MTRVSLAPYNDRISQAKERIYRWNHDLPTNRPPFCFNVSGNEPLHTHGEQASDIDKAVDVSLRGIKYQLENFPDTDYVPFFQLPFLGEGAIPSMFGAQQHIVDDCPPFTKGRVLNTIVDLEKLPARIDPETDGWGPKIKEALEKFLDAVNGEIPVGVCDHQSPYGIATKILGNEELILAMFDEPELVRRFLEICRIATEDTITAMEKWAGNPDLIVKNYRAPVPGCGIIIWDDYISVLTPDLHKDFCVPENNKLFRKYGKGHLHTCGPYFPGFIDAVLEHDAFTIDTVITREMKRLPGDFLEIKRLCSEKGIKLYGNLNLNEVHIHHKATGYAPDNSFLRQMLSDGKMFRVSGGTAEEGREQTAWFESLFN